MFTMISFLRTLKILEKEILEVNPDNYNGKTKKTLKLLIQCIESGSRIKSESSRFYMKNFRLDNKELCRKWNQSHDDKSKSDSTVRSQLSTLNSQLSALFGNDIDRIFYSQDEEGLNRISDTAYALLLNEKFNTQKLFSKRLFPKDFEYSGKEYEIDDCLKEIQVLIKTSDLYTDELLKDIDLNKLFYVRQILDEEIIGTTYRTINKVKLQFLKGVAKSVANLNKANGKENVESENSFSIKSIYSQAEASMYQEKAENCEVKPQSFSSSDIRNKLIDFSNKSPDPSENEYLPEKQQRYILTIILNVIDEKSFDNILNAMNPKIVKEMIENYKR